MLVDVTTQQYIDVKNYAYKFYESFSKLDTKLKVEFIEYISILDNMDVFLKEVIVTTLLYPNDNYLLARGKSNNLFRDIDNLLIDTKLDRSMLNFKRKEFQFMDYSKLLLEGNFKDVDFDKFPKTSDDVYQEYLKNKNKNKISKNEKKVK